MNILNFLRHLRQNGTASAGVPRAKTDIERVREANDDAELVPLFSHRSGYVREAALTRAGELLLPTLLPHLMPRINDWVQEVRQAARIAVDAYLLGDRFDDILYSLPYVYWLRRCGRGNHMPFIEHIEKFLVRHRRAAEIPATIVKCQGIHARSLFELSWKYTLAPKPDLIRFGLASKDMPTLRNSCRGIIQLPDMERLIFGRQLLQAKAGGLRYEGFKIVSGLALAEAKKMAASYLLDEYTPLRELAEKLSGQSQEQLSLLRQEVLRSPPGKNAIILTAIKLSGSLKDKNCEALLEGFLQNNNSSLRGAALLALTRISPGKFNTVILNFLCDEAPAVVHGAAQAFLESRLSMTPGEWIHCVQKAQTKPHFQKLAALARKINKWDYLGVLLECSVQNKFPDVVREQIHVWLRQFNRSFARATQQQLSWISLNLAKYEGKSPSSADIAFYLS